MTSSATTPERCPECGGTMPCARGLSDGDWNKSAYAIPRAAPPAQSIHIDFSSFRWTVPVDAPAPCGEFLRYMAKVVDLNQHDIDLAALPIDLAALPQAAMGAALAVMRLGALPAVSEGDVARVRDAFLQRYNNRPYNAEILQAWLHETAYALTQREHGHEW